MNTYKQFYEDYFISQKFSPEESLKQKERIVLLEKIAKKLNAIGIGLIVGAGKGLEMGVGKGKVFALDLPFTYLPLLKEKFPDAFILQGDGTNMPFSDNTFDWLVCSEVLEHVPNREDMISEFSRVLKPDGTLILTTPNWLCLYGLFRKLAEFFSGKPVHAGDQPLDQWTTPAKLRRELAPYFAIKRMWGWWYFPPIGRGEFQLFPKFFAALWKILMPLERFFQVALPWFGHSVCVAAKPKKLEKRGKTEQ